MNVVPQMNPFFFDFVTVMCSVVGVGLLTIRIAAMAGIGLKIVHGTGSSCIIVATTGKYRFVLENSHCLESSSLWKSAVLDSCRLVLFTIS